MPRLGVDLITGWLDGAWRRIRFNVMSVVGDCWGVQLLKWWVEELAWKWNTKWTCALGQKIGIWFDRMVRLNKVWGLIKVHFRNDDQLSNDDYQCPPLSQENGNDLLPKNYHLAWKCFPFMIISFLKKILWLIRWRWGLSRFPRLSDTGI